MTGIRNPDRLRQTARAAIESDRRFYLFYCSLRVGWSTERAGSLFIQLGLLLHQRLHQRHEGLVGDEAGYIIK